MKIKILGLPIIEITRDPFSYQPQPGEPLPDDPLCQPVKGLTLPVTEEYRAASHKRKVDVDAIMEQYGVDIEKLQRTTYPNGSLGQMLKSTINSRRALSREEAQPRDNAAPAPDPEPLPDGTTEPAPPEPAGCTMDALHTMTGKELVRICNRNHKLDIDRALSTFKASEADILGAHFTLGTAGYRLREAIRMRGHRQQWKADAAAQANPGGVEKVSGAAPTPEAEALRNLADIPSTKLPRFANGKLDVLAGLKQLNIRDPRLLWQIKAPYGSALHLLKQVVGSAVGNGAAIDFGNGITHAEVKEVL